MVTKITIYTSPTCVHCDQLKTWLDDKEIEYDEKNVLIDEAARVFIVQKSQQLGVPVTIIQHDQEESMVIGFNPEKLGKELGISN
ncbi:MAG: glutaredoxin family protein [Patescibacteria group bacterium]